MANENHLEGIKCPDCGQEDRFIIAASVKVEVTDDGADIASPFYGTGFEWDDDSYTRCPECDREGTLKDFSLNRVQAVPEGTQERRPLDLVGAIIAYESGELDQAGTVELFQHLVDTGTAWQLQGSIGRTARDMIEAGLIEPPAADTPRSRSPSEIAAAARNGGQGQDAGQDRNREQDREIEP